MDDHDSNEASTDDDALDALHRELLERSSGVAELDASQIEAWVSGLFAAFDEDADALGFVQRCEVQGGATAAALCSGLAELAVEPVRSRAAQAAERLFDAAPEAVKAIGTAHPCAAWLVKAPFGTSLVVGFRVGDVDEVDHCALIEIDGEGALSDVQMAGGPEDLLSTDALEAASAVSTDLEVDDALLQVRQAWRTAFEAGLEPSSTLLGNQHLLRRRIDVATGHQLPLFRIADARSVAEVRDMTEAEIAAADAAALSTLDAAVPVSRQGDIDLAANADDAWIAVLTGTVNGLSPRERDGLLWLEWADWLGACIGLLRTGQGASVDGETLVDHVNKCPEVSSTVPAGDRDYAIWAFEVAVDHLEDHGLVEHNHLTDRGLESLRPSLVAAWTSHKASSD